MIPENKIKISIQLSGLIITGSALYFGLKAGVSDVQASSKLADAKMTTQIELNKAEISAFGKEITKSEARMNIRFDKLEQLIRDKP